MQRNLTSGLFRTDFIYQDEISLRTSASLKDLVKNRHEWKWNQNFIDRYLKGEDTWPLSPIDGFQKVSTTETPTSSNHFDFLESINTLFDIEKSPVVHIALSGGLDSQVLALYAKEKGFQVKAYSLKSGIDGYCEAEQVQLFCQRWSIDCYEIKTDFNDFSNSLPPFLLATECPIYNLHPVSKWILAREISALGIQKIYSGDGADQAFAGSSFCDLFFLTKNCFEHFKVDLITPLANWPVLQWAQKAGPYLNKEPLRRWAYEKWNLGHESKKSNFFPDQKYEFNSFDKSIEFLGRSLCAE